MISDFFMSNEQTQFSKHIKCTCCLRHQVNRPISLYICLPNYRFNGPLNANHDCVCGCRHYARHLVRIMNQKKPILQIK